MPSTKLNDAVNQLADGEFTDWCALDGDGGKEWTYRKLCKWHRGRCPYDSDEEKLAFKDYDINSLRKKAVKELDRGMAELRVGLPNELKALRHAIATQTAMELEGVLTLTQDLKAHAEHRGYFERLNKIIAFEKRVVSLLCEGKRLRLELRRLKAETAQAKANLVLEAEITAFQTDYFEKVRAEIYETGLVNHEKVDAYNASNFAKADVSGFPFTLICKKLLLDEFFLSLKRDTLGASKLAERVYLQNSDVHSLSPSSHSRLLMRLARYYSDLGEFSKAKEVIQYFEAIDPESDVNFRIYLKKYVLTLFLIGFDTADHSLATKSVEVFQRNKSRIVDSEHDKDRLVIFIFLMTYFLGCHEGFKAKEIFDLIYKIKDQKPHLQYRIQYMISHLMILFELKDERDMKSFAKNYQAFLEPHRPFSTPALEVLYFLRGNLKHHIANKPLTKKEAAMEEKRVAKYNGKISNLLEKLQAFQSKDENRTSLWYEPFYQWIISKRLKLVNDDDLPNSVLDSKGE